MDYKVYVTLGFHINFYHSWRGDTPDEAGFGTDMRVIREILRILGRANAAGLSARGYWDTEVYWTFQEILPKHCPDILEGIRRRVDDGLDEIVLGPFNNGANHAATADEFRAAVAWAIENEWGSGLKQLFGKVAPIYRPQETMFTTGQETIFKECGVDGIMLYYAGVPFNSISAFIPALADQQRYNPLWFKSHESQPPLVLLPCIAAGDLIEQTSLESLMRKLHARQMRGEIQSDVIININEDADLETWLSSIKWMPNMGGLEEFIQIVNKYPWAAFTLPSEYIAAHPPQDTILVRQDLADGGFDGNYSWAEKSASMQAWSLVEQSRLHAFRAESLARRAGLNLDSALWDGADSSFFQRLIGLSTTHFGMSTPVINEERQNRAIKILSEARRIAINAERTAAQALQQPSGAGLYDLTIHPTPPARSAKPAASHMPVRLAAALPAGEKAVIVEDSSGTRLAASFTDVKPLPDGRSWGQVLLPAGFEGGEEMRVWIQPARGAPAPFVTNLKNQWLEVNFSEAEGIQSFSAYGEVVGGAAFLSPFVTYDKRVHRPKGYQLVPLTEETWDGLQRVRLRTTIPMRTPAGEFSSELEYTFTLCDSLPYLFVDVKAGYAYTPPTQVIHNMTQKLRRLMDLRWEETAPFQLTPAFCAPADMPLRVWKHNHLGITSYYDLDYGRINPKNRDLDAFNHQVTAGWVALSNRRQGLLIGENALTLASMAFCPMRLRESRGMQTVSLNPFGSYYGKPLDYSHLGGNGNGTAIMQAFSGALQPNGPSFNGETLRFSLLLAPYSGDEPPQEVQDDAGAYFYPPGAIVHNAPAFLEAVTLDDIEGAIASEERKLALHADAPLEPPTAFLANPSPNAVDLVWDAPREGLVSGYEIGWQTAPGSAWHTSEIPALTRWRLEGLEDGRALQFRIRSLRGQAHSAWTAEVACIPGAVTDASVTSMLGRVPPWTLVKVVAASLWSLLKAWR